ncbi:MAG TPA: extracellular solute-binding protein, partial [Aestuariivirgaceae bacterium]|nr:extracellular solute-binding protein [Aestuariivirgaceae bacterium]
MTGRSLLLALGLAAGLLAGDAAAEPIHGIAMHGEPQLPQDFSHFPYVNPDAPQGGVLRQAVTGSFDSLNPFIIRGQAVQAMRTYVFESLMSRNKAEPFSLYGLIAESIDVAPDRSRVTFNLDPRARFSDGTPVTAADVTFSLETLRDHGRPNHRTYYSKVERIEAPDDHTVTFHLPDGDRELVLILGLMPVLPRHAFAEREFEATTLEPLVGSGPYTVAEVRPGERVVFRKDPDYWGRDLPAARGLWNFDEVRLDLYRDDQTAFEAFRKGLADVRFEIDPTRWSRGYDFPAVARGDVVLETIPDALPAPVFSFVFNTRRALFADPRVREAMIHAFNFEWANENLFHDLFQRTQGYFDGSELSSVGNPASARERELLEKVGADLPEDILEGSYRLPVGDRSGRDRDNLRRAGELMAQAGWTPENGVLTHEDTGEPFVFELLVLTREQERIGLHYKRLLGAIGVNVNLRQVDSSQFQRRLLSYDFDMVPVSWDNSLSPGNEQVFYWGSFGRTAEGTRNYMGA